MELKISRPLPRQMPNGSGHSKAIPQGSSPMELATPRPFCNHIPNGTGHCRAHPRQMPNGRGNSKAILQTHSQWNWLFWRCSPSRCPVEAAIAGPFPKQIFATGLAIPKPFCKQITNAAGHFKATPQADAKWNWAFQNHSPNKFSNGAGHPKATLRADSQ